MQRSKNAEIGFNLYDLKDRPTSSPTAKKGKTTRSTSRPREAGTTSASATRLVATPPPKRSPAERAAGTLRAHHRVVNGGAPHPSGTKCAATVTTARQAAGHDVGPRQSSASRAGELELSLQGLVNVSEQLLEDDVVQVLTSTLRLLQQSRKLRKGARPVASTESRRLSGTGPGVCDRASVSDCLVRACECSSRQQCLDVLTDFYESRVLPLDGTKRPAFASLVGAAMAEYVLTQPSHTACPSTSGVTERHARALEALDMAVSQGHVGAMLRVGLCLRDGAAGLEASLPAALTWIERAASTGYAPAMHEMGTLYENGLSVGQSVLDEDWGAALSWYRKAAERGHRPSQLDLGKLLLMAEYEAASTDHSDHTTRHALKAQAIEWLESAAAAEDQEAIRLLQRLA